MFFLLCDPALGLSCMFRSPPSVNEMEETRYKKCHRQRTVCLKGRMTKALIRVNEEAWGRQRLERFASCPCISFHLLSWLCLSQLHAAKTPVSTYPVPHCKAHRWSFQVRGQMENISTTYLFQIADEEMAYQRSWSNTPIAFQESAKLLTSK